jgi:osmotically-inducible protein OsmY
MKTKVSLMTTEGVSTSDLNVDTVDGVKEVKNLLQVVPKSERAVVERSDDQVKAAVEAAFKANRRVNDSGIKVASVNKAVVLLSGKAKSWEANLECSGR